MTHWMVYSYLKKVNGAASISELVQVFPDADIVAEGIQEYNEMARTNDYYQEMNLREGIKNNEQIRAI